MDDEALQPRGWSTVAEVARDEGSGYGDGFLGAQNDEYLLCGSGRG